MKKTLQEIKLKLSDDNLISEDKKRDLLVLLDELEEEISNIGPGDYIKTISSHVKKSTDVVTLEVKNPDLIEKTLNELKSSVREFEASHPKLFENVNNISAMLASMGI